MNLGEPVVFWFSCTSTRFLTGTNLYCSRSSEWTKLKAPFTFEIVILKVKQKKNKIEKFWKGILE